VYAVLADIHAVLDDIYAVLDDIQQVIPADIVDIRLILADTSVMMLQVPRHQQGEQRLQADCGGPGQDDRVPEVRDEQSPERDRLPQDLLQRWGHQGTQLFDHFTQ
jgi:hypothetical protein